MKVNVIKSFQYGGMFFKTETLPVEKQYSVQVVGVVVPCDMGFVLCIHEDNGHETTLPTLVLDEEPDIDWSKLLTKEQIQSRAASGIMFGNGSSRKPHTLLPLSLIPMKPAKKSK